MPRTWFIPGIEIEYLKRQEGHTFIQPRPLAENELALFNKNGLRYQYFTNCRKANNRYGYIGEADTLDPYFSKVVVEDVG